MSKMRNRVAIAIAGIVLTANSVGANPLQITESAQELSIITEKRAQAKQALKSAKVAYSELDDAYDAQKKALALLKKADRAKALAQDASLKSSDYSRSVQPYLQDMGHASGVGRIRNDYK